MLKGIKGVSLMRFSYSELKEYIREDYEMFIRMGFDSDEHIMNAILNEYQYGEGFCEVEKLCIYISLAFIFKENKRDYSKIVKVIQQEMLSISGIEIQQALKTEYRLYEKDMNDLCI